MTKDRRTTCLQCNKPITQTQGRRERKFCPDSNCGQLYWLSTHPKESRFKRIPIEEYEKLIAKSFEDNKEEIGKVVMDIMGLGMAVTKTNGDGKLKRIYPLSDEAMAASYNSEHTDSHIQVKSYPTSYNDLLTMAKNGVDNIESFKLAVTASKLTPPQKAMILSKI